MPNSRAPRVPAICLLALALAGCVAVPAPARPSVYQAQAVLTEAADGLTAEANAGATYVAGEQATRVAQGVATMTAVDIQRLLADQQERLTDAQERNAQIAQTRVALAVTLASVSATGTAAAPAATATEIALQSARTTAEQAAIVGYVTAGLLAAVFLALATIILAGARWVWGTARESVRMSKARADKERHIRLGDDQYMTSDTHEIAGLLPAAARPPAGQMPEPANREAAWRHEWAVAARNFAGWLQALPPKERQRDDLETAGIASAAGWNEIIPVLVKLGAAERHRSYYRVVEGWDGARVQREIEAGAQVLPAYSPTAPPRAPAVAPLNRKYGNTVLPLYGKNSGASGALLEIEP